MFSRAVTEHTRRLFPALGFIAARSVYPDAPEDLLVVLPEATAVQNPMSSIIRSAAPAQQITVRIARNLEDLMQVTSIRAAFASDIGSVCRGRFKAPAEWRMKIMPRPYFVA
jgi:hypothetical protein